MGRRIARRSRLPRTGRLGGFLGHGELHRDAISGIEWPEDMMTRQCGGWRRRGYHHGTHDRCDPIDDCCPPKPGKVLVSVEATDSAADESGGTGTFTITRTGSTAFPLPVSFGFGGTAEIDADYTSSATLQVTIPAGERSVTVTITPIADAIAEGVETVVLSVVPSIYGGYDVDLSAYSATVTIEDVEDEEPEGCFPLEQLIAWHKADAIAGVYGDGDPMTAGWLDSSDGAHLAEAPAFDDPPTFQTNVQNGLPAVRVAATQYLRYLGNEFDIQNTSMTFYAVLDYTPGVPVDEGIFIEFNQNHGGGAFLYVDGAGVPDPQVGVYSEVDFDHSIADAVGGWQVLTWVIDKDEELVTLYRHGVVVGTHAFTDQGVNFGPDQINYFSFMGGGNWFVGDVGEILICKAAHTPVQVTCVVDQLVEKWDIGDIEEH